MDFDGLISGSYEAHLTTKKISELRKACLAFYLEEEFRSEFGSLVQSDPSLNEQDWRELEAPVCRKSRDPGC